MEEIKFKTAAECLKYLDQLKISYKLQKHEKAFNMQEMQQYVKLENSPYIKNLFYYDKKNNFYLVTAHNDTKVEKNFWKQFGLAPGNLRMTREDHLNDILNCQKGYFEIKFDKFVGTLNPFSLVNDTKKIVKKYIIDQNLINYEFFAFHPMENDQTIELKREDLFQFLQEIKREYITVDLTQGPTEEKKKVEEKKQDKNKDKKNKQQEEGSGLKLDYQKTKEQFSQWYSQVITKSELIEYYDISGCYILRPWAYNIWEQIQTVFNPMIKKLGVQNAYFPVFVSEKALCKEEKHIEGFAAEVAWVTKSGKGDLQQRIAIRPTSETIMYPAYSKWIRSHRDLPLQLNQWTNIIRWEFKHPTPFIRTREFLWQEGHTAHAKKEEADEMVYKILEFYRRIYEDLLAIPVIKGIKTEGEKFPGALYTTSVETMIPTNGRAVQAATSHQLGQNFAKMFDIQFQDEKGTKQLVWQTSWGLTTRTIGVLVMFHSDNKGLVLPPKVAHYQVVMVPIYYSTTEQKQFIEKLDELNDALEKVGIRGYVDKRDVYTPGWKFNNWEMKGVPLRIELGPKDFQANKVRVVRRDNGQKVEIKWENLEKETNQLLEQIQEGLFSRAKSQLDAATSKANDWKSFMSELNAGKMIMTPWCERTECEENVKTKSAEESKIQDEEEEEEAIQSLTGAAKTLNIPLDQEKMSEGTKCFACGQEAKKYVLWGRSY